MKKGYVYIITNRKNGTLYIGVTSNPVKRIYEHRNDSVEGFSKRYGLHLLVYYEVHDSMYEAIAREKFLKGKVRKYKIGLIEKGNKKWRDLYNEIL